MKAALATAATLAVFAAILAAGWLSTTAAMVIIVVCLAMIVGVVGICAAVTIYEYWQDYFK